ncbi:MAG TPA: rhodanese-like domain-containing protein [Anaerolineales bacterium]|nr:rhodanese-like domain-containing protein [Anaerolineales bacterium]
MNKRNKGRRQHRRNYQDRPRGSVFTSAFRRPGTQILVLFVVALVVYLILQSGRANTNETTNSLPSTISVSEAYDMYQKGAFVLDVRTQEEWNEFHAPNTTFIPLDQLASRLNEVPRDRQVVVVCRSGNRSQQGREILLNAGFEQVTSMTGGLNEWRASGYPVEP